ncbi:GLPGLI family protein [uncultured Bacteroides sp.]|uniref:GLPGLI family protein n=1 Tax=uncultured Bacteroides sp. TaxID=162156 RepID=UPI002AAB5249|nr:GLPGLI family protein [uncultured Bacteroides sp.]
MNRIFIIVLFLFIKISCFPQHAIDSAYLKVTYLEDFVMNAENLSKKNNDELVLNIGKYSSEFYSLREDRVMQITDSIMASGGDELQVHDAYADLPRSMQKFRIYKNLYSDNKLTYIDEVYTSYYKYEETIEKPIWTFLQEKKEIQGYSCQKAKTKFKGREWTAWFTTEIPVSDGPWKLCGLPGLILAAADSDSLYHFYCVGVNKLTKKKPIKIFKAKYIVCDKKEFYSVMKRMCEQPFEFFKRFGLISVKVTDANGRNIKLPARKYIDMEVLEPAKK